MDKYSLQWLDKPGECCHQALAEPTTRKRCFLFLFFALLGTLYCT